MAELGWGSCDGSRQVLLSRARLWTGSQRPWVARFASSGPRQRLKGQAAVPLPGDLRSPLAWPPGEGVPRALPLWDEMGRQEPGKGRSLCHGPQSSLQEH